jgi:DNA repair exonuclease SbcCD ATPase subunit
MSEVIIKNKYLDFGGLQKYDALIKGLIATGNKELADAIAALDAKIGNINVEDSDAKNLAEIVDGIYASIADIVETQVALEEKDADLAAQIKKVADDLQFVTGGDSENEATIGEINAKLEELKGSVDKVAADATAAAADAAQAKTDAAAAVEAAGQAQADAAAAVADAAQAKTDAAAAVEAAGQAQAAAATAVADAAQAKEDAAVAAAAVEILVGEGDGSVKKIAEDAAAEAVAAVVAGAESDFDTLKEVAEWISADKEGSAALQATVSEHTTAINTINVDIDALEKKVDDDIANLTTHMSDAATALAEVDRRLGDLEAFEETHESIPTVDIEGLFA